MSGDSFRDVPRFGGWSASQGTAELLLVGVAGMNIPMDYCGDHPRPQVEYTFVESEVSRSVMDTKGLDPG